MVGRDVSILNYANLNIKEETILEIKDLSKKGNYKNINLKLYKGEVLGITGLTDFLFQVRCVPSGAL